MSVNTLSRKRVRFMCIALLVACFAVQFSAPVAMGQDQGSDATPSADRFKLAIVATPDVQDSGLSDLLTVTLSNQQEIDLVERELLQKLTAELKLSELLGAKAAGERLRLGQRLKADMLVLLAYSQPLSPASTTKAPPQLRLVVADCRYGARLGVTLFDYNANESEGLVGKLASRVMQIRRRYSGKIERIYAVSAFVSKSLSRRHDYLQTGFVNLLQESLMSAPGTACLELEEVQAIDRELRENNSTLKDRHVPLFLKGDFNVTQKDDDGPARIRLTIQVADGEKELLRLEHPADTLKETVNWLRDEAADAICEAADQTRAPLSRERQKMLMVERAEYLDNYSMWKESLGLRRAAYLLDPTDLNLALDLEMERVRVLAEPIVKHNAAQPGHWNAKKTFEPPEVFAEQQAQWEKLLQVIERSVATGGLNHREAALLARLAFSSSKTIKPTNGPYSKETKKRRQELFRTVFGQFRQLDRTINDGKVRLSVHRAAGVGVKYQRTGILTPTNFTNAWLDMGFQCCFSYTLDYRGPRRSAVVDHRYTLPNILFLLTEAVPENEPPLIRMASVVANEHSLVGLVRSKRISRESVLSFFDTLEETGTEANQYYARVGRTNFDLCYGENGERDYSQEMDDRLTELVKYSKEKGYTAPPGSGAGFARRISNMQRINRLYKERRGSELARLRPIAPGERLTKKRHTGPEWWRFSQRFDIDPQIGFEQIEGIKATWDEYRQVGPSLDIAWSLDHVYVIPAKGEVRKVFEFKEKLSRKTKEVNRYRNRVRDVRFDGQQLWISTENNGVWAISLTGEVLGHAEYNKELPPNEATYLAPIIRAIEPGKCLAIAGKVWIATLSLPKSGEKRLVSKLIYQATERQPDVVHGPATTNRQFPLAWALDLRTKDGREVVVVGKRNPPLQIELPSLKIDTYDVPLPQSRNILSSARSHHQFKQVPRGYLYVRNYDSKIELITPVNDPGPVDQADSWKRIFLFQGNKLGGAREKFIEHEGSLYCVGKTWRKIDPNTLEIELLADPQLPPPYYFDNVARSAHYGLIAWNHIPMHLMPPYRVIVPPEKPPELYALEHIPFAVRKKHAHALKTLWSRYIAAIPAYHDEKRATRALLWRKEQMGEAQLKALTELHDLKALVFQQVPLTDEQLQRFRGAGVAKLTFYETEVTDAGLDVLTTMPFLEELWLEGSLTGKEFTDEGLRKLTNLPIKSLTLFGHGFTDKSADILLKFPRLESVTPYDTAISAEAIGRLKANGIKFPNANTKHFPGRRDLLQRNR